ncbi:hypothetical protein ACOCJ5_06965 [Knoellia sp. CPCC 206450]|uniref:hypothetical protein n=1 Tax=Knoellia tibetensis TaxID=3404798 RepID=UPI003B439FB8
MAKTLGVVAMALLGALLPIVVARRDRRPEEPIAPVLLGLELARLAQHLQHVEDGNQPSKAERLAASTLAYDLALRDYCRSVDVPVPEGHGTLSRNQRFELETALLTSGHDW